MGFDFSGLNDAVINTFADDGTHEHVAIFVTETGTHKVEAIFLAPYEGMSAAGVPVDRQDTTITVISDDISGINLARRDKVTVRCVDYLVVSIGPDDGGMTEIIIGAQ